MRQRKFLSRPGTHARPDGGLSLEGSRPVLGVLAAVDRLCEARGREGSVARPRRLSNPALDEAEIGSPEPRKCLHRTVAIASEGGGGPSAAGGSWPSAHRREKHEHG